MDLERDINRFRVKTKFQTNLMTLTLIHFNL